MAELRRLISEDEKQILVWRSSPEVASFMMSDKPISEEEHHRWFSRMKGDSSSSLVRILEHNGLPSGFSTLTNIDQNHQVCEWGGYLAPDVPRGIGVGKALLFLSIELAYQSFAMNRIEVEVLVDNRAARHLYQSFGFEEEGVMRERAQKSNGAVNVVLMSLLKNDWLKLRASIEDVLVKKNLVS